MKTITSKIKTAVVTSALVISAAVPLQASAGGLIGDLIGGDLGRSLDEWHKNSGQPLDNMLEGGMDYYAPGTGTARKIYRKHKSRISNLRYNQRYVPRCQVYVDLWGNLRKRCM